MWTPFQNINLSASERPTLQTGDSVLGITIKKVLHQGVFSFLYLGESDGQKFVIKVLKGSTVDGFLSWQNESRFLELEKSDPSPFIWPIKEWEKGLIFPYFPGQDLRTYLQNHSLETSQALNLCAKLVLELSCLHGLGIVHHDLKPENILYHPQTQRMKFIDFGLAWRENWDDFWLETNRPIGTPDYIAPECLQGERGLWQSDVFSIGVLCYELITGRLPFLKAKSKFVSDLRKWIKPAPLSRLKPGLSTKISETIMACLEPKPENRPDLVYLGKIFSPYLKDISSLSPCILGESGHPLFNPGYLAGKPLCIVFIRPDQYAAQILEQSVKLARKNWGILYITFIPNNLIPQEAEIFRIKTFSLLSKVLIKLRQERLIWGLRIIEDVVPSVAAMNMVNKYKPKKILAGNPGRQGLKAIIKPGVVRKIQKSTFKPLLEVTQCS
ncbi:protein kinase [Desulfohalobiaceae bacterium Ax17]|uniref:serine/threonine protein kinase n=1 Tax=Desulfovulcanus ferrireducens TaxID=2831190 RepID=UPI00207BBC80|nr:protein kinase [Desulfovulcanus ferrireducens]MBT8762478.1 protein kinase [Desulfovulcanus ferrireducens]